MLMSNIPCDFHVPVEDEEGQISFTKQAARAEIGLITGAAPRSNKAQAAQIEVTIWAEGGKHALGFAPSAALAMMDAMIPMLSSLFPERFSREEEPRGDADPLPDLANP